MRKWAGIVLAAALLISTSACGGDDDKKDESNGQESTEFGDLKPEDVRASPAEVAVGFRELDRYAAEVISKLGVDDDGAAETQERLLTIWESILGTVKANDEAAYTKLDTALALLMTVRGAGDKAGAQTAADTVKETGADYLKRFPGTGSAAPASTASPSGTDEPADDADSDSDVESDVDAPVGY